MTEKEFDILLTQACDLYCKKTAEEFLSLDTTGFEITEQQRKRFEAILCEVFGEKEHTDGTHE